MATVIAIFHSYLPEGKQSLYTQSDYELLWFICENITAIYAPKNSPGIGICKDISKWAIGLNVVPHRSCTIPAIDQIVLVNQIFSTILWIHKTHQWIKCRTKFGRSAY